MNPLQSFQSDERVAYLNQCIERDSIFEGGLKCAYSDIDGDFKKTNMVTFKVSNLIEELTGYNIGSGATVKMDSLIENKDNVKNKERIIKKVLKKNKYNSVLYQLGLELNKHGKAAIKLHVSPKGKISFAVKSTMEFIAIYDEFEKDELKKVIFYSTIKDSTNEEEQRIYKQEYFLLNGECVFQQGIYDGNCKLIEDKGKGNLGIDFIPVIIVQKKTNITANKDDNEIDKIVELIKQKVKKINQLTDSINFGMFEPTVFGNIAPPKENMDNNFNSNMDYDSETLEKENFEMNNNKDEKIPISPNSTINIASMKDRNLLIQTLSKDFTFKESLELLFKEFDKEIYESIGLPEKIKEFASSNLSGVALELLFKNTIMKNNKMAYILQPVVEELIEFIDKILIAHKDTCKNTYGEYPIDEFDLTVKIRSNIPKNEKEESDKVLSWVSNGKMSTETGLSLIGIENPKQEIEKIIEERQKLSIDSFGVD